MDVEVDQWAETGKETATLSFRWTVTKVSFHVEESCIVSPPFSARRHGDVVWQLKVWPGDDDVVVSLHLAPSSRSPVLAKFQLSLRSKKKSWSTTADVPRRFRNEGRRFETTHWSHVLERALLYDDDDDGVDDDDDVLSVVCRIEFAARTVERTGRTPERPDTFHGGQVMAESLFESRRLADFTFVVDGVELAAHKAVVADRCPVFAAMFQNEMREKRTNRAVLEDVGADTFQQLLRYIYTGRLEEEPRRLDDVVDLLAAAERYGLEHLKEVCETTLCRRLSADNVVELLVAADLHRARRLERAAVDLLRRNAGRVVDTQPWKSLERTHPHLFRLQLLLPTS